MYTLLISQPSKPLTNQKSKRPYSPNLHIKCRIWYGHGSRIDQSVARCFDPRAWRLELKPFSTNLKMAKNYALRDEFLAIIEP